jgi:hypothetical protein
MPYAINGKVGIQKKIIACIPKLFIIEFPDDIVGL